MINEGEGTGTKTKATRKFKRFEESSFNLKDMPRSGRQSVLDESDLEVTVDTQPLLSIRDLAAELGISQRSVVYKLHQFQFVHKKPRQHPHVIAEAQAGKRVEVCRQLLNNPLNDLFWQRIVTSDEK